MEYKLVADYPWLDKARDFVAQQRISNRLAHGYLFSGISGLGKFVLANEVAKFVLCESPTQRACGQCRQCHLVEQGHHADLFILDGSEERIGIDDIRTLSTKLISRPQLAHCQVAIVNSAERMTPSAANALLKTLEEPTPNTFIILVSSQPSQLLPTIISRVQKLEISAPDISLCQHWLSNKGYQAVPELLRYVGNAPLAALAYCESDMAQVFGEFGVAIEQWKEQDPSLDMNTISGPMNQYDSAIDWFASTCTRLFKADPSVSFQVLSTFNERVISFKQVKTQIAGANKGLQIERFITEIDKIFRDMKGAV